MAGGNVGMRRRWGSASPPALRVLRYPIGLVLKFPNGATGQSRQLNNCRLEVEAGGGAVGDGQ